MHIAEIFARSVFGLCGEFPMVYCFMICHIGINGMENSMFGMHERQDKKSLKKTCMDVV